MLNKTQVLLIRNLVHETLLRFFRVGNLYLKKYSFIIINTYIVLFFSSFKFFCIFWIFRYILKVKPWCNLALHWVYIIWIDFQAGFFEIYINYHYNFIHIQNICVTMDIYLKIDNQLYIVTTIKIKILIKMFSYKVSPPYAIV